MSNNLLEIFTDYYERLCHSIPYDDLVVSLVDQQVLTMEEAQKVPVSNAARNARESAEYLLETHVHKPLSNGDKQIFHKLLLCMKKSDKCAQLAAEIERRIDNKDETDSPLVTKPAATKEPTTVEPLRTESNKHVEVTEQPKPAAQDTINRKLITGIVAPRISAYWDTVAAYLEYPIVSTREIDRQCRGDPRQCCITLLEDWFIGSTGVEPKNWSTLVEVLSEISDIAAATQEIKRLLSNERVI